MRGIAGISPGWGVTAVRLVMGIILVMSGWGKYQAGMAAVSSGFEKMGMPVPGITGPFIMLLELIGGSLLILGVATRWLGFLFAVQFIVATFFVQLPRGFASARLELMLLAGGILLLLAGPGRAAVDEVWLEKR
ncbi:MAG: DoxX family protein [Candidatus Rokuibacteriota bacterium]